MAKQKERVEFRYYEIPEGELVLALLGEDWVREYGKQIRDLHFHNLMEIGYCHWGSGEVVLGQEHIEYSARSIMIVPPRLPHTTNSRAGTRSFWEWMYLDINDLLSEMNRYDSMIQNAIVKRVHRTGYLLSGEKNQVLEKLLLMVIDESRNKKPYYQDSIQGLLRSCMVEFLRLSKDEEKIMGGKMNISMISGALDYVSGHFMEELKISSLAGVCNMSESHFRRVFEERMNMKPVDYINLIRIQGACELLKRTNKSMEEVASESGFASISAFNRNFRKILNISPYQWKKSTENYESKLLYCRVSAQKGWE